MTPISPSNTSLVPQPVLVTRNVNCLSRSCISRKQITQKLVLPLSTSVRLFPSVRTCILHCNARSHAAGTEVAIEEAATPVVDKDSGEPTKTSAADIGPAKVQPRQTSASRKNEMPPVENEELVAGATFTGKVRSIQPFGAFINFGAFTDGLVHVSRLSDSFVKDVGTIVSIGQEVKVRLVEVNLETRRISLTMRDSDDTRKVSTDADRARPRRNSGGQRREKVSKFSKGQNLVGTVKNINRAGAFITLPEGEEGFLPTSEEADGGLGSMMMDTGSSLDVGQEVNVKVLKIVRGQVTLTLKKEDNMGPDSLLQGTVHTATNPFLLAFRQNKEIASFLDERENELEPINNDELPPVANKDDSPLAVATEESLDAVDQITEAAESNVLIEIDNTVVEEEEVAIETTQESQISEVTENQKVKDEVQDETPIVAVDSNESLNKSNE